MQEEYRWGVVGVVTEEEKEDIYLEMYHIFS